MRTQQVFSCCHLFYSVEIQAFKSKPVPITRSKAQSPPWLLWETQRIARRFEAASAVQIEGDQAMLEWLQSTALAQGVAQSLLLTATLSAVHMLGFTLVTGSALFFNLRLLGVVLAERPSFEITRPASVVIAFGLVLSIVTGSLMFAGRAMRLAVSDTFQVKMLLLLAAAGFHFFWAGRLSLLRPDARGLLRLTGVIGLVLWLGLAVAACVFILFE